MVCGLQVKKEDCFIDDLGGRRHIGSGKVIELEDSVIKVLQFLCSNYDDIAIELNNTNKGEPVYGGRYSSTTGFISYLNKDLKISFERKTSGGYVADIYFFYKNLCVMSARINADNEHHNGDIKSIELFDSYAREETRHQLEKPFQQYLDWIVSEIYNPITKKIKNQKLFKDNLYDEYIESIKTTESE